MSQVKKLDNDDPSQKIAEYASFVKWTVICSQKELSELDNYIQDKIKDLVTKFRLIAENAAQASQPRAGDDLNKEKLKISGKEYSYSEATKELHKLTDAILAETEINRERAVIRKKIDQFSLALYKFAEGSEDNEAAAHPNIQIITENIKDIIVAFQFQDFVKQRLTHIDIILKKLEEETSEFIKSSSHETSVPDFMAKGLLDQFFLTNVKETFLQGLDPAQAKNLNVTIEAEEDDIELF